MAVTKILLVDDEKQIVNIIKAYLEREGYRVTCAYDGKTALDLAQQQSPDIVILDLMLPEISGWDVCKALRKKSDIPIIMLTARDEVSDRIVGLELGADDYITKPFDPGEVISRVRAVLRRSKAKIKVEPIIRAGDLIVDIDRHTVKRGDKKIDLTPIEFELLRMMAGNPNRVFTRMQLLENSQGDVFEGYERTIDSHIKNLRKKIEPDPNHPHYIITVYGVGYKLSDETNS